MTEHGELRDRLRRETGTAHRAFLDAAPDSPSDQHSAAESPHVGGLYVLPQTAEWPIEWAVVDRNPPQVLTLPADTGSWVGSGDIALPSTALRSDLCLRCRFGLWVHARVFERGIASGSLDAGALEAAVQRWQTLADSKRIGTLEEREVDIDSEYLDWTEEVLAQARRALASASEAIDVESDSTARSGTIRSGATRSNAVEAIPTIRPRPRRGSAFRNPMALAASVLLVVSLGLGRQLMVTERARGVATEDHRQRVTELEGERQLADERYRQDVERLQSELERNSRQHQQQIAELEASKAAEAARRPSPSVNVPFAVLSQGPTRSGSERLRVPTGVDLFLLILRLELSENYPRYRLQVYRAGEPRVVWSTDQLTTTGAELTVALPRGLLSSGDYELHLAGLPDADSAPGSAGDLGVYALTLEID
ncbi:MAG: hypothetical protein AAF560_17615 [Acidobacteriota bacterium]